MKDRTLDYLNQLRPLTTNSRNQGQQIYKNYRNEGVSNYPHMRDYERTMAQLQAEKENAQKIPNEYQQNVLKLEEEEGNKYNQQKQLSGALYKEYYDLLQKQADENAKQNLAWAQQNASKPIATPAQQVQKVALPVVQNVSTQSQKNAQREREAADLIERNRRINAANAQSQQYPTGIPIAPNNWSNHALFPLGSYHNHIDPNNGRRINQPYENSRFYDRGYF